METQTIILYGSLASLGAGMMTAVGAIPCLFIKKISPKFEDTTLGFAAGVMLGASFFSLIVPGLDYADELWQSKYFSVLAVLGGLLMGVLGIWSIEKYSPHEHFVIKEHYDGEHKEKILKIWLFIIAITIHNMPEGLAVGVGFGGETDGVDWDKVGKGNPTGRVGTPEDIAGLTIFLCSRAGAFVVGETIALDGGVVATS